jgi:hypothetical protein
MLILKYPAKTRQTNELEERLQQLSLAHQTQIDPALTAPVLIEGKITIAGAGKINEHLDELARELYFWQYCSCARVDA